MERRNREEELKLLLGDIQIGTSADLPENHCHLLRQYLPSHNNPPETSIPQNGTLETAIARLNLSAFPHQSQFLPPPSPTVLDGAVGAPMPRQPRTDPLTGLGLSPLSVQRMQQRNLELQRLRIAAYLQSQGIPTMGAESLGSYGLARSNLNSTDVSDESYSKFLNGGRTETEINRSGKCCCCCCNHRNEQHQLSGPNGNGFRLDSGRQYRGRAINGLVSESENSIMKSLLRHHSNHLSLEDLRGKILSMAKDQHGCRFLQQKFKEGNAEDIEMIFSEVKDHMGELMLDQFGNYFVQKLLDVCNEEQRTEVLLSVTRNEWGFITICLDTHGTRAVQRLMDHLTTPEQIYRVMSTLSLNPVILTKHTNGHHVIQNCLKNFSVEENKCLLNAIADNCVEIAKDKSGCFLLQQCLQHIEGELRERLVAEITANALILAEDCFGNYVVQYILGMNMPRFTADLLRQLEGRYVYLSMNKSGSNVVEKCLKESGEEQITQIIMELINSPDILMLVQHPFGNYVIQRALDKSKGPIYNSLVNLIQMHSPALRNHPFGRRVLARINTKKHAAYVNMYNVERVGRKSFFGGLGVGKQEQQ